MVASIFLSRILAVVRDQVMVWSFGRNEFTDAYRWAFSIPDLMFFLIAGGALSSAFIPVFSEYLHTDRKEEAWKIFSSVTTLMSLIVLTFIVAAWIWAMPLSYLVAPGAEANPVREHIVTMSRIVLPAQYAFFIGGLMFGTLYSHHKFAVPGLGPNIYNLGIIAGALTIGHIVHPGVIGMSWGALVGAFAGNILVPMVAMRSIHPRFKPSLDLKHPGVKKVLILMLPVVLGLSLPGVYGLIMQAFSSFFSKGTATAIDMSNKLMQAPLGIFGQSLAIAVFPALSQFFAHKQMDKYAHQLSATVRTVIYITLPISAVMVVLSPEIVGLLFQYGSRFKEADTQVVAACLQMFGFGVTGWCLHPVLMRGFFAMQNSVTPIVIGTATTAVFVTLAYFLRFTALSYLAMPLASSICAVLLAIALLLAVRARIEGFHLSEVAATFLKCFVAVLAMVAVMWVGTLLLPHSSGLSGKLVSLGRLLGFGLAGAWAYYGITRLFKMPETAYVNRTLERLTRRRPKIDPPCSQ